MSTQHELMSTDYTLQTIDGVEYRVYADGRKVKAPKSAIRTVGRGSAGEPEKGKGKAGANIFRAQAIEHIVNNRGWGGGSNPNGWDDGDIGMWGRTNGVTVEDLQNLTNTQFMQNTQLVDQLNTQLVDAGVLNEDGTQRVVQWGDNEQTINQLVARSNKRNQEIETADAESRVIENDISSNNTVRTADNVDRSRQEQDTKDERDFTAQQNEAKFGFDLKALGLENDAKMEQYKMELERADRRDRRDNIAQLIAGLATLGAGFAM